MAISSKEAAKKLDAKIAKALLHIEEVIDQELSERWFTGCGGIYVTVDAEEFRLPTVATKIANKYAPEWCISPVGLSPDDEKAYRLFFILSKDLPKQS